MILPGIRYVYGIQLGWSTHWYGFVTVPQGARIEKLDTSKLWRKHMIFTILATRFYIFWNPYTSLYGYINELYHLILKGYNQEVPTINLLSFTHPTWVINHASNSLHRFVSSQLAKIVFVTPSNDLVISSTPTVNMCVCVNCLPT